LIDLSIVILNWNTRTLLTDCLSALKEELNGFNEETTREVIVVDNGSTDGSADAVRAEHPWARVVALDRNLGFASGNNVGMRAARGETILLLNTDVVLEEGAIELCLAAMVDRPDVGAVGLQLIHPDGRLQNSIHTFPSFWSELFPTWLLEVVAPGRFPSKRFRHETPIEVDAVLGAVLFVRRETLERVGPMPEEYFFFLEETDWCWQMRSSGFRVLHVPYAKAVHLSGASSKQQRRLATRIEYCRSLDIFLRRRRGNASAVAARGLRIFKWLAVLPGLAIFAIFSPGQRRRLGVVLGLLGWHFRGCPSDSGLAPD
jgi:GT2 family glycosyltransferase